MQLESQLTQSILMKSQDSGKSKSKDESKDEGKSKTSPLLDSSEINVARIFSRVVSYRYQLGLGEATEDEVVISLVPPACFSGVGGGAGGGDVNRLAGLGGRFRPTELIGIHAE